MKSFFSFNQISNRTLYVIIFLGLALFLFGVIKKGVLYREQTTASITQQQSANFIPPTNKKVQASGLPNETLSGFPARVVIPKINVDAQVEFVGMAFDGSMDVPQDPDNVGWFQLGARPGEIGSAVMAGHRGWRRNRVAVFDHLSRLTIGDKVQIVDDLGVTFTFVVTKISSYDSDAAAPEVFVSDDGKAHLNLVTCTGFWNRAAQSSTKRLVVFTEQEIDS